jgi:sugar O-acyltransferase (sialic acid O-acetyltransferase NeuD family)
MNTESAVIFSWLKREGDSIAVGEILAEVETVKVNMELEAETAGVLRKLLVDEGQRVAVNQAIALIGAADEDVTELVQRLMSASLAEATHASRVYQAWRQANEPSAALEQHQTTEGHYQPADAPPPHPEPATRRLDAEGIRARLAQRGLVQASEGRRVEPTRSRLLIYGSGLGAKQVLEVLRHVPTYSVVGLLDDNPALLGTRLLGLPVLGGFATLAELVAARQVDGVVLSFHSEARQKVHRRITAELGCTVPPLIDPRAAVGMDVDIGPGALIEAGTVLGPGTSVGEGVIVDVGAIVAHDCFLGPFSHLSPGCRLSGVVCLRENVLVGVGASINSTVTVGRNVIIAPGAAVMNDVGDDVIVSGVPAKVIGTSRRGAA